MYNYVFLCYLINRFNNKLIFRTCLEMSKFKDLLQLTTFVSFNKILLFFCHKSTEFTSNNKLLVLIQNVPIRNWYLEQNRCMLNKPPLFVYFQYILSIFVAFINKGVISEEHFQSVQTVYFQRFTVVLLDIVLALSAFKWSRYLCLLNYDRRVSMLLIIFSNCGLFLVDHLSFGYNGLMMGIFLLSIYYIAIENECIGVFLYAVLLNLDLNFLYPAPALIVYLLRNYCIDQRKFNLVKFLQLVFIFCSVFLASFGPFALNFQQVIKSVFSRKKTYARFFWGPNFWEFYKLIDFLVFAKTKDNFLEENFTISYLNESQLVHNYYYLPPIFPEITFLLVFLSIFPCLYKLFTASNSSTDLKTKGIKLVRSVQVCSFCCFMFGWNVEKKSILIVILPSLLLAFYGSYNDKVLFFVLQYIGHYSLFPLFTSQFAVLLRFLMWSLYSLLCFKFVLTRSYLDVKTEPSRSFGIRTFLMIMYLFTLLFNEVFCNIIFPLTSLAEKYSLLPLMLNSACCSIGFIVCFLYAYKLMFVNEYCSEISNVNFKDK